MGDNMLIWLGDHFEQFIERQVDSGRYKSASVCAGLRLLEHRETKLSTLRAALADGEDSGDFQELDADRFLASMHQPAGR